VDLAGRLNCNIRVIASIEKEDSDNQENGSSGISISAEKDRIYGKILELKGCYHGLYNQWNSYETVKIQVVIYRRNLTEALVIEMRRDENNSALINPVILGNTGLTEEIMSDLPENDFTVFILPGNKEFRAPDPNLVGIVFKIQKRENFSEFFSSTKILTLPGEIDEFEEEMIIRQAG
jgi:hypothetical protein